MFRQTLCHQIERIAADLGHAVAPIEPVAFGPFDGKFIVEQADQRQPGFASLIPARLYQRAKMLMHHALKMLSHCTGVTKVR